MPVIIMSAAAFLNENALITKGLFKKCNFKIKSMSDCAQPNKTNSDQKACHNANKPPKAKPVL